jgi:hypothetical protein
MILEYILIGVIAFSVGHSSGKHKEKHKEQIVVIYKHKKHKIRKHWKNHKRHHAHRKFHIKNEWRFYHLRGSF